ncbi:MAG TPA: DUF4249 domain-containing protein [Saprospiraceae bacterium]|nr:DUF4249 domain-containing protein [Saprospiraceae bacterium]HMQ85122.1 DUF4249 domain-containing protein [Saprospiraceae bacterium]
MKNWFLLLATAAFLFSCEKTVTLDLKQSEEKLVIEAQVTDQPGKQYVKISKSVPFNGSGQTPRVSGAIVSMEDDQGNSYEFEESSSGLYLPLVDFKGEVDREYTLTVSLDGQVYTASDRMHYVPPFDSLGVRLDEAEMQDPEEDNRYYEVLVYIKEPPATTDYYLAKFYRDDKELNDNGEWVFVYDDFLLGEEIDALPFPYYYAEGEKATVEMYSLSRSSYKYYLDILSNIDGDGGMFSGQPANIRSNIEGGAIGHFLVTSIAISEKMVGI